VYLAVDVTIVKLVGTIFVLMSFSLQHHLFMEALHVIILMLLIFVLSEAKLFSE
jgi:hypothetical protein